MWVLMGTVFIASLLGSLHCVGMCGPFALVAAADPEKRSSAIVPTFAYSFGRLISYSVVGLVFGTLGMAVNQTQRLTDWQQSATYLAGGLMIAVGLVALMRYMGVRIVLPSFATPLKKWLQHGFQYTVSMPPLTRALTIGLLTSLMPCGWLYAFAITAAGTGSPMGGVLLMVTFWAGTVPVMAALMMGANRIGNRIQRKVPVVMALVVIALGVFTLIHRAPIAVAGQSEVVSGTETLIEQVSTIDQHELPCCRGK